MLDERVPRETVFTSLDVEREYQEQKWDRARHSVEDYLLYIEHYLNSAKESCVGTDCSVEKTMTVVRKITALGVACMEDNGVTWRKFSDCYLEGYHGN